MSYGCAKRKDARRVRAIERFEKNLLDRKKEHKRLKEEESRNLINLEVLKSVRNLISYNEKSIESAEENLANCKKNMGLGTSARTKT